MHCLILGQHVWLQTKFSATQQLNNASVWATLVCMMLGGGFDERSEYCSNRRQPALCELLLCHLPIRVWPLSAVNLQIMTEKCDSKCVWKLINDQFACNHDINWNGKRCVSIRLFVPDLIRAIAWASEAGLNGNKTATALRKRNCGFASQGSQNAVPLRLQNSVCRTGGDFGSLATSSLPCLLYSCFYLDLQTRSRYHTVIWMGS